MPKSYADKVAYWRNKVTLYIRPKSETHIHHDHSKLMQVNTIEDVRLFTLNAMELTWVQGLNQLSLRLLNRIKTLDGSYQIMMNLFIFLSHQQLSPWKIYFTCFQVLRVIQRKMICQNVCCITCLFIIFPYQVRSTL